MKKFGSLQKKTKCLEMAAEKGMAIRVSDMPCCVIDCTNMAQVAMAYYRLTGSWELSPMCEPCTRKLNEIYNPDYEHALEHENDLDDEERLGECEVIHPGRTHEEFHAHHPKETEEQLAARIGGDIYALRPGETESQREDRLRELQPWRWPAREERDPAGFTEEQAAIAQSTDPALWNALENEIMNPSPKKTGPDEGPAIFA